MIIVFYDGGTLECSTVEFTNDMKNLIADECRIVPLIEVIRIVSK